MKNKNLVAPLSVLALGCALIAAGVGAEQGWPRGVMVMGIETTVCGLAVSLISYLGSGPR